MINLLPEQVKQSVKFARYNVRVIQYSALALIVVFGLISMMLLGRASLIKTQAELEKLLEGDKVRIAELVPTNAEANKLAETITVIDSLLDKEIRFSSLLQEIGAVIPPGAALSGLTLSQEASEPISMAVLLDTAEKAGVLQENLLASDLFLSADILDVSRSSSDGEYRFATNIQAFYNPELPLSSVGDVNEEDN